VPSATRTMRGSKPARAAAPRSNAGSPAPPPSVAISPPLPPSTSAQAPSGAVAPPLPSPTPLRTGPAASAASGTRAGDDGQDHGSGAAAGKREAAGDREASSSPAPTGAGSGHSRDD
jgi:hypothetical protein